MNQKKIHLVPIDFDNSYFVMQLFHVHFIPCTPQGTVKFTKTGDIATLKTKILQFKGERLIKILMSLLNEQNDSLFSLNDRKITHPRT